MARVVVYGASDDLIELEGDLYEEFDAYDAEDDVLTFSEGTKISVTFDREGQWRLRVIAQSALTDIEYFPSQETDEGTRDADGCPEYSDKLVLVGPIDGVKYRKGKR